MTILPKLDEKNINYIFETAEHIADSTENRRAGSEGEEQARRLFLNEFMKYCDETTEQSFPTHPGVGTFVEKVLCAFLIVLTVLFFIFSGEGVAIPVILSLFGSLFAFCLFVHKILFDGVKLDFLKPKKKSGNLLGRRYARGEAQTRVVIVSHLDSPQSVRGPFFDNRVPFILSIATITGNTLLFCSQLLFLFAGAPQDNSFFSFLSVICLIFIPIYIASMIIINPKRSASGVSSALIPSAVLLGIMRQFSEDSFRYEETEVCFLITGSEYSSRAGSYAFAKKHRRLFSDVRTIFIPLEEITSSERLSVFFRDGSGTKGSAEVASVIAQAAENLELNLTKESSLLGTSAFSPFAKNHFQACALGTSKKLISRSVSPNGDKLSSIRRKTVSDVSELLIETLNYYDS